MADTIKSNADRVSRVAQIHMLLKAHYRARARASSDEETVDQSAERSTTPADQDPER